MTRRAFPPAFAAVLLALTASSSAGAQTSIPPARIPPASAPIVVSHPPPPPPRAAKKKAWTAKAEASYVATSGNVDSTTARVGGETVYKPDGWSVLVQGAFLTRASEDKDRNHRIDALLRASRAVSPRLEMFGQVLYLRNTFSCISHSVYPLGGLAYAVLASQPHSLKTRVGLGYGQENRLRQPSLGFATADAETAYRWALSRTAELREDSTFTKNLSRAADWRFANVASVAA